MAHDRVGEQTIKHPEAGSLERKTGWEGPLLTNK